MRKRVRGALALLWLVLIVVVVPYLLLTIGSLGGLSRVVNLDQPDDGTLLVSLLTAAAWLAWLVVIATIVFEALAQLTVGRISIRVPGTGWFRPTVTAMLIALGGLVATQAQTIPALATDPAPQPTDSSATQTADPQPTQVETQEDRYRYRVSDGDDLWSLAEHFYGQGSQWRKIASANPWLNPAAPLESGMMLVIPDFEPAASSPQPTTSSSNEAPADPPGAAETPNATSQSSSPAASDPVLTPSPAAADPSEDQSSAATNPEPTPTPRTDAPAAPQEVEVTSGDTLWDLADEHLGDPTLWPELYELNQPQVADPDHIEVGWVLQVPGDEPADEPPPPAAQSPEQPPVSPTPTRSGSAPSTPVPSGTAQQAPSSLSPITPGATSVGLAVVAAVGGALAAGLLGMLSRQRLQQLVARKLGRRVPEPNASDLRVEQALAIRSQEHAPEESVTQPTSVLLGWAGDEPLTIDLEENSFTALSGEAEAVLGSIAAISSSLVCADWSQEVELHLVGRPESWTEQLDEPRVTHWRDTTAGIDQLVRLAADRRAALGDELLAAVRADPDRAESWRPTVFVFCDPLDHADIDLIRLELVGDIGVSAVSAADAPQPTANVVYQSDSAEHDGQTFTPQLLESPARRALIDLMRTASSTETTPAPWWSHEGDLPPNVTPLNRAGEREESPMPALSPDVVSHPTLLLLGPVELIGAAGDLPSRAIKQCQEYCAWILNNPGSTSTTMAEDLVVAEATRRSNMSRLRTWLGSDSHGELYLPDAYSGRIQLHPDVTSDWEHFCLAVTGGIDRASTGALRQALEYVRGAPLADAAPWQWIWAEALRSDMVSAIRDAGVVLAERAIELNDVELARWAIARAEAAAPQDELLLATKVLVFEAADEPDEVKRLVLQLTRASRDSGVDLSQRTVSILQRVMEGRRRAQQV